MRNFKDLGKWDKKSREAREKNLGVLFIFLLHFYVTIFKGEESFSGLKGEGKIFGRGGGHKKSA